MQVSGALNPDSGEGSKAFQECVLARHPRHGEFAIAFITGRTVLQVWLCHCCVVVSWGTSAEALTHQAKPQQQSSRQGRESKAELLMAWGSGRKMSDTTSFAVAAVQLSGQGGLQCRKGCWLVVDCPVCTSERSRA